MSEKNNQTNVLSTRFGTGAIRGIGKEAGRFVVATMDIPWKIVKDRIGVTPEHVYFVDSVEQTVLDKQVRDLPACDTILGIGGGKAIDAAKYISWKRGIRLVSIPTIISVDAFVTPAAGVRVKHEVIYVGESFPDPLIIDYDVIRTAPRELALAGIGDLLSMHTACYDWKYAGDKGRSEYPLSDEVIEGAHALLKELYAVCSDIRDVTDHGIRTVVEATMGMNELAARAGHWRFEEGSEHYLFYELEERLKRPFIHGHIVGLGIYLMSRLQNNRAGFITGIMDDVGLKYHPRILEIKHEDLMASLKNLKSFVVSKDQLWYTIIDDSEISENWIRDVLSNLQF